MCVGWMFRINFTINLTSPESQRGVSLLFKKKTLSVVLFACVLLDNVETLSVL